jgi:hypothetical protein
VNPVFRKVYPLPRFNGGYPEIHRRSLLGIRLQILAKQIIVDPHGKIVEHKLNSPFVYLRSLAQNLSTPEAGKVVRNMSAQGYKS